MQFCTERSPRCNLFGLIPPFCLWQKWVLLWFLISWRLGPVVLDEKNSSLVLSQIFLRCGEKLPPESVETETDRKESTDRWTKTDSSVSANFHLCKTPRPLPAPVPDRHRNKFAESETFLPENGPVVLRVANTWSDGQLGKWTVVLDFARRPTFFFCWYTQWAVITTTGVPESVRSGVRPDH